MAGNQTPDVTVLLTTRNRAALLRDTLAALRRVDVSGLSWDLIVVDNGSRDDTPRVLEQAGPHLPLTVLTEPTPGKSHALNRAFASLRAPLLVFTDDDVVPDAAWLAGYVRAARRWPEHRVFGGPIIPAFPPGTADWLMTHPCTVPAFAAFTPALTEGPMKLLPFGPNVAYRRHVLWNVLLSSEMGPRGRSYPMGTDTELVRRVLAPGERAVFVPAAGVRHVVRPEQLRHGWLMRRAFNLGRGMTRQGQLFPAIVRVTPPEEAWRHMLRAGYRYARALPHGPRQRLECGADFHYWRGYRYEQRRLAREARVLPVCDSTRA